MANGVPVGEIELLSRQDALSFVREKLKIEDIGLNLETLSKIQRHLMSELPFQNVSIISKPLGKRFPTAQEALSDGLSLRGGACANNNWFTYILLKALGFDIYVIGAIYCEKEEIVDLHMMTVVRGIHDPEDPLCKETLFLVDAASGYPLPHPVALHRLPISFPETAGIELSFTRIGDMIYRLHHDKDPAPGETHPTLDGWKVIMKFSVNPRDPASLGPAMEKRFSADPPTPFMKTVKMFRWPLGEEWAVAVRGNELMFFGKSCPEPLCAFDPEKQKHKMMVKDSELEDTIMKHFPSLCREQLQETLKKIREMESTSAS